MTEITSHVANQKGISAALELNNNNSSSDNTLNLKENSFTRPRSVSRESMSSASSSNSDTSEDAELTNFGEETKDGNAKTKEGSKKVNGWINLNAYYQ